MLPREKERDVGGKEKEALGGKRNPEHETTVRAVG
jgi:hypothetical protein